MHEEGECLEPAPFQFGMKRQRLGPDDHVAQVLSTATRLRGVSTVLGGRLAIKQFEGDLGQLPLRIIRPFPSCEDFRHPFPVAKLDVGDVHACHFAKRKRCFQHHAVQEALLEFVQRPIILGALIQFVHFLFDVE